jgi:putative transposase
VFSISRFQQLLKHLPRGRFDGLVEKHGRDRHSKGFRSWDQLLVMVCAQLQGRDGLREAEAEFNAHRNHHYHLGTRPVRRSTLADANAKRSPELFADVARSLMAQVSSAERSSCNELLCLIDSTSITLKGREFDSWTLSNRTRNTQGVKLHMMYEAGSRAPVWQSITAPNVNDRDEGVRMPIDQGNTYVFDKGYCDYNWWRSIDARGARFVTRFKRNASLLIDKEREIATEDAGVILRDQVVRFAIRTPGAGRYNKYEHALRRVEVAREGEPPLVLATNDLDSPATEIAGLYKDRWQIELFFKWIKQHLNVKRFMGRSENAVRTQILVALITYLLLVLEKQAGRLTDSLWATLLELRSTLFSRPSTEEKVHRRRRYEQEAMAQHQASWAW